MLDAARKPDGRLCGALDIADGYLAVHGRNAGHPLRLVKRRRSPHDCRIADPKKRHRLELHGLHRRGLPENRLSGSFELADRSVSLAEQANGLPHLVTELTYVVPGPADHLARWCRNMLPEPHGGPVSIGLTNLAPALQWRSLSSMRNGQRGICCGWKRSGHGVTCLIAECAINGLS